MLRLRDFQPVLLQVGDEGVPCRVVARQRHEAVLLPDRRGALDAIEGLEARQAATLSFECDNHPALLHGLVDHGPLAGTTRFAVLDPLGVPEPRRAPRMPLDIPAVVKAAGATVPQSARTVDIGRGGVLLRGLAAAPGTAVRVLLHLPGAPERLELDGRVVRTQPGASAVAFVTDAQEVADFVLRCRAVHAEQLAERTARRSAALAGR